MKRAQRRYDQKNKLKRTKSILKRGGFRSSHKQLAIHCNTRTRCSCHKCGNPRRWFGRITRQEIRSLEDLSQ